MGATSTTSGAKATAGSPYRAGRTTCACILAGTSPNGGNDPTATGSAPPLTTDRRSAISASLTTLANASPYPRSEGRLYFYIRRNVKVSPEGATAGRSVAGVVVEIAGVVGPEPGQRSARAVACRVAHDVRAGKLAAFEGAEAGGEVVADRLHAVGGGDVVQGVAVQHRIGTGAAVGDVVLDADRSGRLVAQRVAAVAGFLPERPDVVHRAGGALGGRQAGRHPQDVVAHALRAGLGRPGRRRRKGDRRGEDEQNGGGADARHSDSRGGLCEHVSR